jgi:hypothetical protein
LLTVRRDGRRVREFGVQTNPLPKCPDCEKGLSFVAAWSVRGVWGYTEVRTYECPVHGPIFVRPETPVESGPATAPPEGPDGGNRDSWVTSRRKPKPTLNADSIAIPEPD